LAYGRKMLFKFFTLFLCLLIIFGASVIVSILYPIKYKDYINKYAQRYNIDPFLVAAIINVESKYNKDALSPKKAKGLMQIGQSTGQWGSEELGIDNYSEELLFQPETNIRIGVWYLNKLEKEFNGDLDLMLAAYNAGSGNVNKWLKDKSYSHDETSLYNIPFKETENYLKKVKSNYKVYKLIYKRHMFTPDEDKKTYIDFIHYLKNYMKGI